MYTDGSCYPNPGNAGWACILSKTVDNIEHEKTLSGHLNFATNNQVEFKAVLEGIRFLTIPSEIIICTDSKLIIGYLFLNWKRNNDQLIALVNEIDRLVLDNHHDLGYKKIVAHSGHDQNERCDLLAKSRIYG